MIAYKIIDIKQFMNSLLLKSDFDSFLLYEANVKNAVSYFIEGKLNSLFFEDTEEEVNLDEYILWKNQKEIIYNIFKGKNLPIAFKFILMLNRNNKIKIVDQNNIPIREEDIRGLYLNIYYENEQLKITTGVSIKAFTLDKTLDNIWDENISKYLKSLGIAHEPM